MTHLDEAVLQALLDDELDADARTDAERHLATCASCAATLAELRAARDVFASAMARVDAPAPVASALFAVRRRSWGQRTGAVRQALLRAAMLVLGLAGAAAASVPGSPVRRWITRLTTPAPTGPVVSPPTTAGPRSATPAPLPAPSGVSITPANGRVRVALTAPDPALRVRVRVWSGEYAEVAAPRGPDGPRFRTRAGEIEVVGAGAGQVLIRLPRGARTAVVEADGRVLAVAEQGRLRALAPSLRRGDDLLFRLSH